jgi:hypothetical protein
MEFVGYRAIGKCRFVLERADASAV